MGDMTTDEKLAVLARALLQLAEKAAVTWDYDGEVMHSTGVVLDLEGQLKRIVSDSEKGTT